MNKLFIDTASTKRIASVITDDKIKSIIEEENGINLSVRMLPIVEQVLKDAQLLPTDIAEIYVIDGPGSFTGIRVGITIAKVYAWALKKKIVPLSELELLATTPFKGNLIVPYIDARRDYAYAAIYDQDLNIYMEPCHISRTKLLEKLPKDREVVFVSYDHIQTDYPVIKPNIDIVKILNKHRNDTGVNPHECNPHYLKMTEAEEKMQNGVLHD